MSTAQCSKCAGTGRINNRQDICPDCNGSGTADGSYGIYDKWGRPVNCPICKGKGTRYERGNQASFGIGELHIAGGCDHSVPKCSPTCTKCGGKGYYDYEHNSFTSAPVTFTLWCENAEKPTPNTLGVPHQLGQPRHPQVDDEDEEDDDSKTKTEIIDETCPLCNGDGWGSDGSTACPACGGSGRVQDAKKVAVKQSPVRTGKPKRFKQ